MTSEKKRNYILLMKKKEKEGHDKNIVYSNYDEECCGSV
jgi:hypothetical protein